MHRFWKRQGRGPITRRKTILSQSAIAMEALESRKLMSVTLNAAAGVLLRGDGASPLPEGSTIVVLVDATGDGFGDLATSPDAFTNDDDDQIVYRGASNGQAVGGVDGAWLDSVIFDLAGDLNAGDAIMLVWYDTPYDVNATGPGEGVDFGTYTNDSALDGGEAWVVPPDGNSVTVNFFTQSFGGSNLDSVGIADATTSNGSGNQAPVLDAIGGKAGNELEALTFTASATDPETGTLTFSLDQASLDAGMTIDPATGQFNWTPTEAQGPGSFQVTITVTDDGTPNASDSETITITVGEVNIAPALDAIDDAAIDELTTLAFNVTATDTDLPANTLIYSLDQPSLDAGMTIDAATGAFSFTPSEAQGGSSFNVIVTVSDGNLSDTEAFSITVNDVNAAPVLAAIGDRAVEPGASLTVNLQATDADLPADTLSFSVDGLPVFATFVDNGDGTATIEFNPGAEIADEFEITVTVTDDVNPALTDSETFTLTVADVNMAPVLDPVGNKAVDELATLTFTVTGSDPADTIPNNLTFSLDQDSLDAGMTIDASTGEFNWTPTEAQGPGAFQVTITVTDDGTPNATDSETITITVGEVNIAPVLNVIADQQVNEGGTLNLALSATDADLPANTLSFAAEGLPSFALLTDNGDGTASIDVDPDFTQSGQYVITVTVTDSANPAAGDSQEFTLTVVDQPGAIGNLVFFDTDGDGVQDQGELGVADVTVRLLDGDGELLTTTTTDEDGIYRFDDLLGGSYIVEFVPPEGQVFTTANVGDDGLDSDAAVDTGRTSVIVLAEGEVNDSLDAGLVDEPVFAFAIDADRDTEAPASVTFTDANGDTVTVSIRGAGSVQFGLTGNVQNNADISTLELVDTDESTQVTVRVSQGGAGDGETTITNIIGEGARRLDLSNVDLIDGLTFSGGLGELRIDDILDGAQLTIGGSNADRLRLTADQVGEVTLSFPGLIDSLTVGQWTGGQIEADAVKTARVAGAFGADLILAALNAQLRNTIGSFTADGAISGSWSVEAADAATKDGAAKKITAGSFSDTFNGDFAGDVGTLDSRGNFEGFVVARNFKAIKVASDLVAGTIIAGGGATAQSPNSLGSFKVGGSLLSGTLVLVGVDDGDDDTFDPRALDSDDVFKAGNDNFLKSASIKVGMSDDSRIRAGALPKNVKVGALKVVPSDNEDPRFVIT